MGQHTKKHDSIRHALADHTRCAHESLHHHHWISRLTSPSLTKDLYFLILAAYLECYRHLERSRSSLGVYESLNLRDAVANLEFDTAGEIDGCKSVEITQNLTIDSPFSMLGALYVLHGARFGASILNRHVSSTLPDVPRHFLQNTTPTHQWRALVTEIELLTTDRKAQQELFNGADDTFTAFGRGVTEYCVAACHVGGDSSKNR